MADSRPPDQALSRRKTKDWNDPEPVVEGLPKTKWSNWAAAAGILVAVFLVIGLWPTRLPDPASHPAVGQPMPLLHLEGLTGGARQVNLDGLRSRVVLLTFWSASDAESTRLLAHLISTAKRLESREDFAFLPVSCQAQASLADLRNETAALLESNEIEMPTYWDPDDATLSLLTSFSEQEGGEARLPVTALLDRDGVVRGVWYGYTRGVENQIAEMAASLLDQR